MFIVNLTHKKKVNKYKNNSRGFLIFLNFNTEILNNKKIWNNLDKFNTTWCLSKHFLLLNLLLRLSKIFKFNLHQKNCLLFFWLKRLKLLVIFFNKINVLYNFLFQKIIIRIINTASFQHFKQINFLVLLKVFIYNTWQQWITLGFICTVTSHTFTHLWRYALSFCYAF